MENDYESVIRYTIEDAFAESIANLPIAAKQSAAS